MLITNKLEEVYANLWGLYNHLFQSKSIYTTIFMYKHTSKMYNFYLQEKNNFVDTFQA